MYIYTHMYTHKTQFIKSIMDRHDYDYDYDNR